MSIKNEVIAVLNDTKTDYPFDKTVVELFEEQVGKTPHHIAVTSKREEINYEQLNNQANQVAQVLLAQGVQKEDFIGIMAERTIQTIVGMLGILKAGGAYMPIDPNYPEDRIIFMLEDSKCPILLTYGERFFKKLSQNLTIINLNESFTVDRYENLNVAMESNQLAYLMYTSGTTGKPKGVMIEHKSVNRLVKNTNYVDFDQISMLQIGSLSFDAATFEIWGPLLNGGSVHLAERELATDIQQLKKTIESKGINTMFLTPALYNELIDLDKTVFNGLKQLYLGGEAVSEYHVNRLIEHNPKIAFYNGYGPTEVTTFSLYYKMTGQHLSDKTPIGRPLSNTTAYIMNGNELCDIDVVGELYLGGDGVARGYLNRQQLTNEKFIANLFGEGKLYRTGDLAKWLPDGNVEYVGRIDDQVKIRGFRIELGEIESQLMNISNINNAVVLVKEMESSKILCGYVISKEMLEIEMLKKELSNTLPGYMIPTYLIQVDSFPLTKNGKVDKKALLDVELTPKQVYVESRNEKEKIVSNVFKEILGFSEISVLANFYELGGDSIKAIRIISKLRNQGYQVSIEAIMMDKTVERIAKSLEELKREDKLDQSEVMGEVLLTPIQKQFFASNLAEPHHFNQSALFESETKLDLVALKQVLEKIIQYHDMLRATYQNGIQVIEPISEANFTFIHYENVDQAFIKQKGDELQATLDIEKGPLVKAIVFETADTDYLLLCIHHLVVDGISWRIISEDLNVSYEAIKAKREILLPTKTLSFQKWSLALKDYRTSYHLKKEIPFWKRTEAIIKESYLPSHPAKVPTGIQTQSFTLSKELTEQLLYHASKAYNLEINDLLLAALFGALHQETGQTSLATFMEGHGREKIDGKWLPIDRTVSWFTTIYPLAVSQIGSDIEENICLVKEAFRKIPNHGLGYTVLKSYGETVLTNEKPSITFNYLGNFTNEVSNQALKMLDIDHGYQVSKKNRFGTPIVIDGAVLDGQLRMLIEFDTEKFSGMFIANLKETYEKQLQKTIQHCIDKKKIVLTPSDMNEREWSMEEFTKIKTYYEQKGWLLEQILPLTPLQGGMLYHKLTDADSAQYVVQQRFRVKGDLDITLLKKSFELLIKKHQMLRMNVVYQNVSIPRQVIMQEKTVEFTYQDLSNQDTVLDQLERLECEDRLRGFDLENDALIRMTVTKLSNEDTRLRLTFHHIMMDAWCLSQLEQDLLIFYDQLVKEEKITKVVADHQYEDFIQLVQAKNHEEGLDYWEELLADYEGGAVTIPVLEASDENEGEDVHVLRAHLTEEETECLEKISGKYGVTLNTIIEAAWAIILRNYNYQQDVVFGKVVSGRSADLEGIEKMIGLFINTIPVRVMIESDLTFSQLIKKLQEQALKSSHYDYCSLAEIQSRTHNPFLVSTLLNFENYYQQDEKTPQHFQLESLGIKEETNYAINLSIQKSEILQFEMMYQIKEYGQTQIHRILDQLIYLLKQVIENTEICIMDLELMDKNQRTRILKNFNQTTMYYEKEKTIIEIFEEQVKKTPSQVAVIYEDQKLTYQELNKRANAIGHRLRAVGVGPNDYVALMVNRSLEMIVGMFGILKAGGAYVPLDPTYPEDRMKYIFEDCCPKALLTDQKYFDVGIPVMKFEDFDGEIQEQLMCNNQPEDLSYLIYTSGTTGRPKGVMIEHRNVLNLVNWKKTNGEYTESSVILQNFSYVFDGSVWEIFPALLSGCTLEIIPEESRLNPEKLLTLISGKQITLIPSMFRMLLDYAKENHLVEQLHAFDKLYMGGESVPLDMIKSYKQLPGNNIQNIFNAYGPTESTACAISYRFDQCHDRILIGKPVGNIQAYILSGNKLCGVGMIGELCIGGDGVARGYLNRPELTEEKFIKNSFGEGRVYRTGDLARWLPDGNIEYLGRVDDQVKIRGFRIELGEIESALRKIKDIVDAVVVIREDKHQEKAIHAYFVSQKELMIDQVKDDISNILPSQMIPPYMKQIEKIPFTKTGKIDKKALPTIDLKNEKQYVVPKNKKEEVINQIFSDVLAVERISMNNSFFELGGDSIKAIQVVSKMREAGYMISVKEIMDKHIISVIARSAVEKVINNYEQGEVTGTIVPTPIIKCFNTWNLTKPHHYNQSVMIKTNQSELESKQILETLIIYHDMLRAVYKNDTLDILNSQDSKLLDFQVFDFRHEESISDKVESECDRLQRRIDLEQGPLIKSALFKTNNGNYLFICIHHLVIDYVSWRILIGDFHTLEHQLNKKLNFSLPKKTASFQEWSRLLNEYKNSPQLAKEKTYWTSIVAETPSGVIKEDGSNLQIGQEDIDIHFEEKVTKNLLYEAGKSFQTEINDLLLSAVGIAIKNLTGQTSVSIGLEGHGREILHKKIEIDRTVGWFTSIYPVIIKHSDDIKQCIIETKEMLRKVPNNGLGYGLLMEDEQAKPNFYFNYLGEFDENENHFSTGIDVSEDNQLLGSINFNGLVAKGKLSFRITYDKSKHSEVKIKRFADLYHEALIQVIDHCLKQEKAIKTRSDYGVSKLNDSEFGEIMDIFN